MADNGLGDCESSVAERGVWWADWAWVRGVGTRTVLVFLLAAAAGCDDDGTVGPSDDATPGDVSEGDGVADPAVDDTDAADEIDGVADAVDQQACFEGASTTMTTAAGASLSFAVSDVLRYGLEIPADAVGEDREVFFGCVEDLVVPAGFVALSEAVEVDFTGRLNDYAELVIPFDLSRFPATARPSAIRVFLAPRGAERVVSPPVIDLQENLTRGFARFRTRDAGVYQVAVAEDAGEAYERTWRYRAITGVSMGCSGAAMIGVRNPEVFDIIGALGGPTDWTYLSHYIEVGGFGGFSPAPEYGPAPPFEPTEEFEHPMIFDNFWSPTGEGTGGTFDRGEYVSILQDLALAFGNTANYSDASPLLPPGVDPSELVRAASERCPGSAETVLTIESGFYDDEYNPDGSRPVIMFCDGTANQDRTIEFDRYCDLDENGVPDEPNRGLYPGPDEQETPVVIAWAVDVNENGRRELGEPVIRNSHEPYDDVGADGVANEDEDGYDAVERPDPEGDDYDYFNNPRGTEGNWLYDAGEPYLDVGLDGVADTPQLDEGGYDFGEGNDQFDYNPYLAELLEERDPHHMVADLTASDWDGLTIYMDAGIRDLFNFAVATNHLAGQIQAAGQNLRIYDDFFALGNLDPETERYRFDQVDYGNLGDHVYLRYGDPDATEEQICLGDGKHVGPPPQIANRLLTLLGFVTARFPGGDFTVLEAPFPTPNGTFRFYSESIAAWDVYSIILPPGFERRACTDTEDNDGDGFTDGDDPDCLHGMDNDEGPGLGAGLCEDGIDNDQDGRTDFPEDADCRSAEDTSEWPDDHPLRNARFPVIYLLHGYGMTPDDLRATVVPFASFMGGGLWQKSIVVYPDGFCGDNDWTQCNDGVDNDEDELVDADDPGCSDSGGLGEDGSPHALCSDGVDNDRDGLVDDADRGCISAESDDESDCVQGNFFTNHAAWPDGSGPGPPFEDVLLDLVDHVDEVYPTRLPEAVPDVR